MCVGGTTHKIHQNRSPASEDNESMLSVSLNIKEHSVLMIAAASVSREPALQPAMGAQSLVPQERH